MKKKSIAPTQTPAATAAATPMATASSTPIVTATATPYVTSTPAPTATAIPTSAPEITFAPSDKIVYNNYFEDGDTKEIVGRNASLEVSNSNNHTNGGMNSLLVNNRAATEAGAQLDLTNLLASGSSYKFRTWVKQDTGVTQKISMKLQYNDSTGATKNITIVPNGDSGIICTSGTWTVLSGEISIPDYDNSLILYYDMSSSDNADFLIDDVEIAGESADTDGFQINHTIYTSMKNDAVYSTGNNARIKNVIAKARNGEDVTLAYIGGSVTEGALASPNSKCYAQVSANAFANKYGKDGGSNVHFVNAGMSGTPSALGVVRYDRDVLGQMSSGDHPDILFIEFAVNDYGEVTNGGAYEGLIRQALKSGSAVVLVFSVFQSISGGRVMENSYRPYGEHYDLPMISMGDAIWDYFSEDGFYDWYFGDTLHPNNTGYQLMSDCIMNMFDKIDSEEAEADNITDLDSFAVKKTDAYQGIKMIDSSTKADSDAAITSIDAGGFTGNDTATGNYQYEYKGQAKASWFPNNWMHTSTSGNNSLKVNVSCKTFMLVYKQSSSTTFGSADIYVDGVKKTTLNCYNKSGWNNGQVYVAFTDDQASNHEIEVKMSDGSEGKNFTLMAIGNN